jgi:hypothetical protein
MLLLCIINVVSYWQLHLKNRHNEYSLGYNELGCNDLGYTEIGYNELGYNEQDTSFLSCLLQQSWNVFSKIHTILFFNIYDFLINSNELAKEH